MEYEREQAKTLRARLNESPTSIIVVAGPRQVGKTTMVRQVIRDWQSPLVAVDRPETSSGISSSTLQFPSGSTHFVGAQPTAEWLIEKWNQARVEARRRADDKPYVLALDEIQKISNWSEIVKGLWDEDRGLGINLHVVLLGSSPWLMGKGLTESLAGRFEMIRMTHWAYYEMQDAFDFSVEEFIYFGGYPGSARYINDEPRWRSYIRESLIYPCVEKDILEMTRVDKPILLRNLFELGCLYSGRIVAYSKLLCQLQEKGNTTTLATYLSLLSQAGMLTGLEKYSGSKIQAKKSPPKLNSLNTALVSAVYDYEFDTAKSDRTHWGRLVETAIGAHLINTALDEYEILYWRKEPNEVDFVVKSGKTLLAIEVKSGEMFGRHRGVETFCKEYGRAKALIIGEGEGNIPVPLFLSQPIQYWIKSI